MLHCAQIALKLLNWHNLPGGVPRLGEAVSEAMSPEAASRGRGSTLDISHHKPSLSWSASWTPCSREK